MTLKCDNCGALQKNHPPRVEWDDDGSLTFVFPFQRIAGKTYCSVTCAEEHMNVEL